MNPAPRRSLLLLAFAAFVSGASMRIAEPLLPNTDAAARARNRRIEIELRPLRPNG